jgi:hypothetical protein
MRIRQQSAIAYTLPEVMVAVFLVAISGISLYAGFSTGFRIVDATRENLRATQIMTQWMETSRLYTWSQIRSNLYVPKTFTDVYDPNAPANAKGVRYYGTNTWQLAKGILPVDYDTNVIVYTVSVAWTNRAGKQQIRQMQTFHARAGLQNYVFITSMK